VGVPRVSCNVLNFLAQTFAVHEGLHALHRVHKLCWKGDRTVVFPGHVRQYRKSPDESGDLTAMLPVTSAISMGENGGGRMTVRRIGTILAALPFAAGLLGACSSSSSQTPGSVGTVSGTLAMEGGTAPGTTKTPIPGTIALSAHGALIVTIQVPASGAFRTQVPAGTYAVSATTPRVQQVNADGTHATEPCPGANSPITVENGKTTTVYVICIVP